MQMALQRSKEFISSHCEPSPEPHSGMSSPFKRRLEVGFLAESSTVGTRAHTSTQTHTHTRTLTQTRVHKCSHIFLLIPHRILAYQSVMFLGVKRVRFLLCVQCYQKTTSSRARRFCVFVLCMRFFLSASCKLYDSAGNERNHVCPRQRKRRCAVLVFKRISKSQSRHSKISISTCGASLVLNVGWR